MKPLVSILIPTYNDEKYIGESLRSALDQSYNNIEIIISNNNSTDNTESVVLPYLIDNRIKYYKQTENIGAMPNFNFCLEKACGKYILLLSSDDLIESSLIEKAVAVLEINNDVGIYHAQYRVIDGEGNDIQHCSPSPMNKMGYYKDYIDLIKVNYIGLLSSVFRKSMVDEGFINTPCADWHFWIRICLRYKCALWFEPEILASYRFHQNNSTNSIGNLSFIESSIEVIKATILEFPEYKQHCKESLSNLYRRKGNQYLAIRNKKMAAKNYKQSIINNYFSLKTWISIMVLLCPEIIQKRVFNILNKKVLVQY